MKKQQVKKKNLGNNKLPATIQLIVGLGNPGTQYEKTRHNVGAWFVEQLAQHQGVALCPEKKLFGNVAQIRSNTQTCWLLKPTTFMNESGRAVAALCQFYKISSQHILVAHDELDFPAGMIRFKKGGGHGGHNGLRSIIQFLQSNDFLRLRIGVGHPGHKERVTPYVLSEPSRADKIRIFDAIIEGLKVVPDIITGDFQKVFRALHSG